MTARVEAVLRAHAREHHRRRIAPGFEVTVYPDRIVLGEDDAEAVIEAHARLGRAHVKNPPRLVLVPRATPLSAGQRRIARFVEKHQLPFTPVASHAGTPSVVAVDEGLVGSDDIVAGMRADVGALGALGALALKVDPVEVSNVLRGKPMTVTVPATRRVELTGRPARWVAPFDLALALIKATGGPTGGILELGGDTVTAMDLPERWALCATLAAAGQASLMAPDRRTATWLAARRPEPVAAVAAPEGPSGSTVGAEGGDSGTRADAAPEVEPAEAILRLAAARVAPGVAVGGLSGPSAQVAATDDPQFEHPAWRRPGTAGEVIIAGALDALRAAAEVLRERNAVASVRLLVVPASQRVLIHALHEGLLADLVRAGAVVLPTGTEPGPPPDGVWRLSTLPTDRSAGLASPLVAACASVAGCVQAPEVVMRMPRRGAALS